MRRVIVIALLLAACGSPTPPPPTPQPSVAPPPRGEVAPPRDIPQMAAKHARQMIQVWQFYWQLEQPASLAFAQIHQESRWNCSAVSPVGAQGCAQFMPASAEWIQTMLPPDVRARCPQASGCPFDFGWAANALSRYDKWLWDRSRWASTNRDRLGFLLSGYNGGSGWWDRERKACSSLRSSDAGPRDPRVDEGRCDPSRWFDHVERVCLRSPAACKENRHYPTVILDQHWPMYRHWLGS